jgi:hypothetical protein
VAMRPVFTLLAVAFLAAACGGSQPGVSVSTAATGSPAPAPAPTPSHSSALTPTPAPAPAPAPAPPPPHPFAATSAEATSLIDAAIDERASTLFPCIAAARSRRKNPHEKIQIEVGLDEQGHLMGVKAPKGAPSDPELFHCAQEALAGANFPTSHAGIITVTKTFEDQAVYR